MLSAMRAFAREARRGVRVMIAVPIASVVLVMGWFAAGHACAPDAGLHQLDVLGLSERVPG